MPAGQMFYSVAYGKNLMGSYASQLSRHQRWMIIKYIKNKQTK
jgi:SNF family Na+-dependent transporter